MLILSKNSTIIKGEDVKMLKKNILISLAIVLILSLSFGGCAKQSESVAPQGMTEYDSSMEYSENSGAKADDMEEVSNRKIILNIDASIRVNNIAKSITDIENMTKASGGYVKSSYLNENNGNVSLMIPTSKVDGFVLDLNSIGKILRKNTSTEDVTDRYFDTEIRIKNLETEIEIMRKLLQKDGWKISEILEIEREIRRLIDELEILKAQITNMDRRIQFSQLNISFSVEKSNIGVDDESFTYKIKRAFLDGIDSLIFVVTYITSSLVFLLPLLPIIVVLYPIWRFIVKPILNKIKNL